MGGFLGDIPRVTFSRSRVNICQTLPPSLWERGCPTSYPLRLVGGGLPQTPLEPTREQQGVWLCVKPRDLREERVAIDNNAFGGLGVYPLKQRAQPLCIKTFIFLPCSNSIDFLWMPYRLSINFL